MTASATRPSAALLRPRVLTGSPAVIADGNGSFARLRPRFSPRRRCWRLVYPCDRARRFASKGIFDLRLRIRTELEFLIRKLQRVDEGFHHLVQGAMLAHRLQADGLGVEKQIIERLLLTIEIRPPFRFGFTPVIVEERAQAQGCAVTLFFEGGQLCSTRLAVTASSSSRFGFSFGGSSAPFHGISVSRRLLASALPLKEPLVQLDGGATVFLVIV